MDHSKNNWTGSKSSWIKKFGVGIGPLSKIMAVKEQPVSTKDAINSFHPGISNENESDLNP